MAKSKSKVVLFRARSLTFKIFAVGVLSPAFGAITGVALGWSAACYWSLLVVSVAGGLAAGYEHDDVFAGTCRGFIGGALFATGLLLAHEWMGVAPVTILPPASIFLAINCVLGALFGAAGAWKRSRIESPGPR